MFNERGTERKPRVVIRFGIGSSTEAAIQTAVNLARAMKAEIEGELIQNDLYVAATSLPCTRLVSPMGRRSWGAYERDMSAEVRALGMALSRRFEQMAARADVPYHFGAARTSDSAAVPTTAQYIIITDYFAQNNPLLNLQISDENSQDHGIIVTGPNARLTDGPIVAIVEAGNDNAGLLVRASKLAAVLEKALVVVPFCADWAEVQSVEQAFLAAGHNNKITYYRDLICDTQSLVLALRRIDASFAVAAYGSRFLPDEDALKKMASLLRVPILLAPAAGPIPLNQT